MDKQIINKLSINVLIYIFFHMSFHRHAHYCAVSFESYNVLVKIQYREIMGGKMDGWVKSEIE